MCAGPGRGRLREARRRLPCAGARAGQPRATLRRGGNMAHGGEEQRAARGASAEGKGRFIPAGFILSLLLAIQPYYKGRSPSPDQAWRPVSWLVSDLPPCSPHLLPLTLRGAGWAPGTRPRPPRCRRPFGPNAGPSPQPWDERDLLHSAADPAGHCQGAAAPGQA